MAQKRASLRFLGMVLGTVSVGFSIACENGTRPAPAPLAPTPPTVTALTVAAPASSRVGAPPVTATATARLSDGSTEDVSSRAVWRSDDAGVAAVSTLGIVQPLAVGTTTITAEYAGRSGSASLRVEPAAFDVRGRVIEKYGSRPIAGAAIAIASGPHAGTTATSDGNGDFVLRDVSASVFAFRVSATDFEEERLTSSGASTLAPILLEPLFEEMAWSGIWGGTPPTTTSTSFIPFQMRHAGPIRMAAEAACPTSGTWPPLTAGVAPEGATGQSQGITVWLDDVRPVRRTDERVFPAGKYVVGFQVWGINRVPPCRWSIEVSRPR